MNNRSVDKEDELIFRVISRNILGRFDREEYLLGKRAMPMIDPSVTG